MSADQPGVTDASGQSVPPFVPSLFDDPATHAPDTTPGNGNGLLVPKRRHRFIPDDELTPDDVIATASDAERPHELTKKEARQLGRLRARKVRRIVRHVDPWSVLKLSLLFYLCLFVVVMVAGTLLYNLAGAAGTISSIESFIKDIGAFKSFTFKGTVIFRASFLIGLILVIAGSALNVLLAVLFNLISDLVGGIRVTVIEEDRARPISADGDTPRR